MFFFCLFFFSAKNIDIFAISSEKQMFWYSLKTPCWCKSTGFRQHMFYWRNTKKKLSRQAYSLRNHAYSNILKILSQKKKENFQIKNSDIFHVSAQNIACGYSLELPQWGGSNEYPQSMFLSRNKKNNVYPCKPQFYYIKVGFKGVNII